MSPKTQATQSTTDAPPKRARKGTKRSRSGCLTCKFRKVKCDETKPECSRCKAFGIKCDGYERPRPKATVSGQTLRTQAPTTKLLPAPSSSLKFNHELEQRHFSMFQFELVNELAGSFNSDFWTRIVLQGCQEEPFILKTVIALNALSTAKKLSQTGADGRVVSSTHAASHMEFAFSEYEIALQTMAVTLSKEPSPRKALLMCLLVCCFEGMAGNTMTAMNHAKSGQKMLEEWMAGHPYGGDGEGIKSPADHLIEDELVQAAAYLELQIAGCFDKRTQHAHAVRRNEGSKSIACMPVSFRNINEARVYWQLIQRRIIHFGAEAVKSLPPFESCPSYVTETSCPKVTSTDTSYLGSTRSDIIASLRVLQTQYEQEVIRWRASFRELYRRTKASTEKLAIATARTLQVQTRAYDLVLASIIDTANYSFEINLPGFKEIIDTSREVIRAKKEISSGKFFFEVGIIPGLYLTLKWCPDRKLQKEAIKLLRWYDSREGVWDSTAIANATKSTLCELTLAIEEKTTSQRGTSL